MNKVIDNFLDPDYLELLQMVIPKLDYKLHASIENYTFLGSSGHPFPNCDSLYLLEKKVCEIADCKAIRAYVNLNPSGENHAGNFHVDDGEITALFMPMPWNHRLYGGSFKFEDGEEIEYIENRLILFDAKRAHRAMPHTFKGFRYTIAYKMIKNIS